MLAIDLADIVHAADVGVGHLEGIANLVEESLEPVAISIYAAWQELERHRLPELEIVRTVDLAHSPTAQKAHDAVSIVDDRAGNETHGIGRATRLARRRPAVLSSLGGR